MNGAVFRIIWGEFGKTRRERAADRGAYSMLELLPGERPLLEAVLADPDDATARLVYADWLEEHGDERAEYLRLELGQGEEPVPGATDVRLGRLSEMAGRLDPGWVAAVSAGVLPLIGCPRSSRVGCPSTWDHLESTADPTVRVCHECGSPVFFCTRRDEVHLHRYSEDPVVMPAGVQSFPTPYLADSPRVWAEQLQQVADRLGPSRLRELVARRRAGLRAANPMLDDGET